MKTSAVILAGISLAFACSLARAQSSSDELKQPSDPQLTQAAAQSIVFQTKMMREVFGLQVQIDGPVPRAFRAGKPWQLINPLAPAEFGDGYDNVATDPQTGQPAGFRIFEIRF